MRSISWCKEISNSSICAVVAGLSLPPNFRVDYDLIVKNVKELNVIADEGVSHIEKTKDGARLKVLAFFCQFRVIYFVLFLHFPHLHYCSK